MKSKKLVQTGLALAMISGLVFSNSAVLNTVEAADSGKTTIYYQFKGESGFTDGETYLFVPNVAQVTVGENNCLLSLPQGTATLKATSEQNNSLSYAQNFNKQNRISNLQSNIDYYTSQRDNYIAAGNSDQTRIDQYNENISRLTAQLEGVKNAPDQFTLDTYVDVVSRGTGFDSCPKGGLFNGGTYYFCWAGGVQALDGKTYVYKTAEIGTEDVSVTVKDNIKDKIKNGEYHITPEDVDAVVDVDGDDYVVENFEIIDDTIDIPNGDNEIEIKFGETTTKIKVDMPEPETGSVTGRDGNVSKGELKKNNKNTVVQEGSAAALAGKTVNEVIDVLASDDTMAKAELVSSAQDAGSLKVVVNNKDENKVKGSIDTSKMVLAALTGQELVDTLTGNDDIVLTLDIFESEESELEEALIKDVDAKAVELLGDNADVYYINVDLYIENGSGAKEKIDEFGGNSFDITLTIPKQLREMNGVKLIRTHVEKDGVLSVDSLEDLDSAENTYTIATNKLCVMAYAYSEAPVVEEKTAEPQKTTAPKTGDSVRWIYLIAAASLAIILGVDVKHKSK